MAALLATALAGLGLGLSLIVAIGAQNAFVLRQGIRGEHVLPIVVICVLSDAVLILAGIAGLGIVVTRVPLVLTIVQIVGGLCLLGYGLLAVRRVFRGEALVADGPDAADGAALDGAALDGAAPAGNAPDGAAKDGAAPTAPPASGRSESDLPGEVVQDGSGPIASVSALVPTPAPTPASAPVPASASVPTSPAGVAVAARARTAPRSSLRLAILTALALTWLNPSVYIDTALLIGSIANTHGPDGRWLFGIGAIVASVLWFVGIGFGARLLAPLFSRPMAWRMLDAGIALVMFALGARMLIGF